MVISSATVSDSISNNPYILWAMLLAGVLSIAFGALNKSTSGVGAWLASLRRIGADAKAADIKARDDQILNLSTDLDNERKARQADRKYFERELIRRDELSRAHIRWDWEVYNTLVQSELWDGERKGPPPLF